MGSFHLQTHTTTTVSKVELLKGYWAVHSRSPPGPGQPPRNGQCDTDKRLERRREASYHRGSAGRLWNTTESSREMFPLTKDQDEERVQRHHPEDVFLETHTRAFSFKESNSFDWRRTFKGGFLELQPRPALLGPPEESTLTKNTKEPSRPSIWAREKEQCHHDNNRLCPTQSRPRRQESRGGCPPSPRSAPLLHGPSPERSSSDPLQGQSSTSEPEHGLLEPFQRTGASASTLSLSHSP